MAAARDCDDNIKDALEASFILSVFPENIHGNILRKALYDDPKLPGQAGEGHIAVAAKNFAVGVNSAGAV